MIDYAEITLRTDEDRERLQEMTRDGWTVASRCPTNDGYVIYFLERKERPYQPQMEYKGAGHREHRHGT
ncbi:MAG: hypothetical protein WC565_05685 [Parcubacteria group bacterium]